MVQESVFWQICKTIAKFDIALLQKNIDEARQYALLLTEMMEDEPELNTILNLTDHLAMVEATNWTFFFFFSFIYPDFNWFYND